MPCRSKPQLKVDAAIEPEWRPMEDAHPSLPTAFYDPLSKASTNFDFMLRHNSDPSELWRDVRDGWLSAKCCFAVLTQGKFFNEVDSPNTL